MIYWGHWSGNQFPGTLISSQIVVAASSTHGGLLQNFQFVALLLLLLRVPKGYARWKTQWKFHRNNFPLRQSSNRLECRKNVCLAFQISGTRPSQLVVAVP